MLSGKSIALFAVKFLAIYALLSASWAVVGGAYVFFFRESGQLLLGSVGSGENVRIRAATEPDGNNDTLLLVHHGNSGRTLPIQVSSWLMGFQATVLLIALVLATPVSVQRRLWALCGGLLIVQAFVLLRITGFVALSGATLPETVLMNAFRWVAHDFLHGHAVSCFVPVLIWVLVTLRREDVLRLPVPNPKTARA